MARSNGGIIGVTNKSSFGKNTQTVRTSSTPSISLQPGTRFVQALVVAGGAGGQAVTTDFNTRAAGAGGAGGLRNLSPISASGSTGAVTVGGGGSSGSNGTNSSIVLCGTTYSSTGGGRGGIYPASPSLAAEPGGSGGGAGNYPPGGKGCGNAGGYSPPEGNNGGTGADASPAYGAGGGGGHGAVGGN